ncbi:MAG: hypothetical protein O7G85_15620 [Planctomycetota bacterium]|nr:hypothetical protein [Planctomycetota bacterium]
MSTQEPPTEFFWNVAKPFLKARTVKKATMMGFPCLRVQGEFFASCDHRNGDLIAKLPRDRVSALIESGQGHPFSPAGRVFREWVLVSDRSEKTWESLMTEAKAFVLSQRK